MRALWLAEVLRGAGLEVVEQPGWRERGAVPSRPVTAAQRAGEFEAIVGHMAHHTASPTVSTLATNLSVVTNGNGSAPGPIANDLLGRDGTYFLIASGRCNHAGAGSLPWVPGSGNDYLLSTEAVNNGVGEPWSADMMLAYEIGTAAKLKYLGFGTERATTHAEWTTRKIDPAGPNGGRVPVWSTDPRGQRYGTWSPAGWRAAVGRWMLPPPIEIPDPPTEEADEMTVLHLITPTRGEWLWTPGGEPQPLKSVSDGIAILGALGDPRRVHVSDEQLVALQLERPVP